MKKACILFLGVLIFNSACRRDEDDLPYDPNSTEFRFGYNNAAVKVKEFNPVKVVKADMLAGRQQVYDSLDVDGDQIADLVLEASAAEIFNGQMEMASLSVFSTTGLYQFLMGPIRFDTIYRCYDDNDTFVYNVESGYDCQNKQFESFNVVKQVITFAEGEAKIDPASNSEMGWDNQSAPLSNFQRGFSPSYNANFNIENMLIPANEVVFIQIQNRLTGQYGWLQLKIMGHGEIHLYEYGLEKLL